MRNTKNRKKIISVLDQGDAFTAQELHSKLPEIDLATIYRNLKLFVDEGMVKEIRLDKNEAMYEIIHDNHQHAQCKKCEKVIHFKIDEEKLRQILDIEDFEIEDIDVYVKGKCK